MALEPESLRHDLAVKIRGAAFDDPAVLIREVERHRQAHSSDPYTRRAPPGGGWWIVASLSSTTDHHAGHTANRARVRTAATMASAPETRLHLHG